MPPTTFVWTGAVNTDYGTAGNWQSDSVPNATDLVAFNNNPGTVTSSGSALAITVDGTGTLTFAGTSLTTGGLAIAPSTSGNVVLNAGTIVSSGPLTVGDGGTGNLTIDSGGSLVAATADSTAAPALSIGAQGNGSVTVFNAGSTLTVNGVADIGGAGSGSLTMAEFTGFQGNVVIGEDPNGVGGLNVGYGSEYNNTVLTGGDGTVYVNDYGNLTSETTIDVGNDGNTGAMTVIAGANAVADQSISIGNSTSIGAGTTLVSPGGSTIAASGTILTSSGTVSVLTGGNLTAQGTGLLGVPDIIVGAGAGSSGELIVSGTLAAVSTNGGTIAVGGAGNGMLSVSSGGAVQTGGLSEAANGSIVLSAGSITGAANAAGQISGFGSFIGALANSGTLTASGGTLEVTGGISGSGQIAIAGGAALQSDAQLGNGQSVTFVTSGSAADLILGAPQATNGFAIGNWQTGDEIVFNNGVDVTGAQWLGGAGTLAVSTSGGTYDFTRVALAGSPNFTTGSNFVELVSCFVAGTRIRTVRGDCPVEELREGDIVPTAIDGGQAAIVWIGHRTIDCTRHKQPQSVWPVRIRAGAFGPGRPARDLMLSPDHSVYVNGVLIPMKRLVDGETIVQVRVPSLTYYHLELPRHDVVFAEGMPAESYLDVGDRANFANGGAVVRLHVDLALRWEADGCAPLVIAGPELQAVRAMVRDLAEAKRTGSTSRREALRRRG